MREAGSEPGSVVLFTVILHQCSQPFPSGVEKWDTESLRGGRQGVLGEGWPLSKGREGRVFPLVSRWFHIFGM